jgi:hypothetical protein
MVHPDGESSEMVKTVKGLKRYNVLKAGSHSTLRAMISKLLDGASSNSGSGVSGSTFRELKTLNR